MMITIHGFPPNTKYQDVKSLMKQECCTDDFILDNLVAEPQGTKKVRMGLPDDNEGYKVMKCLNGFRMGANYVLKVVPIGKTVSNSNAPPQDGYEFRKNYDGPQRNDYPNQQRGNYPNQPSNYNRGPQGPNQPHGHQGPNPAQGHQGPNQLHGHQGPNQPHGPGGPAKHYGPGSQSHGPLDNTRSWAPNTGPWVEPHHGNPPQASQNTFNYGHGNQPNVASGYNQQHGGHTRPDGRPFEQGRGAPMDPKYGFPPNNNAPPVNYPRDQRNLRNIETTSGGNQSPAPTHGRFPPNQHYQQDKPVTIMKENFQGPTPFNINHPGGHQPQYPQAGPTRWPQPDHSTQQPKPPFSKGPVPYEKPFDDRKYGPPDQTRDPKNLPPRPDTYKESEKKRGFSPPGRRDEPSGRRDDLHRDTSGRISDVGPRRLSPGRDAVQRRGSPGRRISPQGRRISPPGRRISPQGRREDHHGRRYSPSAKRISPGGDRRNISASSSRHDSDKRLSPGRRLVSPGRRDDRAAPRFSPTRHHSDKGDKYDSKDPKKVRPAYEPSSSHASNQAMYSGGYRPNHDNVPYSSQGTRQEQPGPSWQRRRDEPTSMKKQEDEKRDTRMQMNRDRNPDKTEKHFSPSRKSRSPNRRDRSPNRRDRSPLRDRYKRNSLSPRSSYSPRRSWALEKRCSPDAPPPPVWPGSTSQARTNFSDKEEKPTHKPVWKPTFKASDSHERRPEEGRSFNEGKIRVAKEFRTRDDYEERHDNYRRRDSPERMPHRDDFNLPRRAREDDRVDDYNRRRESPHQDRKMEVPKIIDEEFDDIFSRTMQFKKKTEERKKVSATRKIDNFDDKRPNEKEREDLRHRYEEHLRYREERNDRGQDDRQRDDRVSQHDERRPDYRSPRDIQQSERERDRNIDDHKDKPFYPNSAVKQKRFKAIEEISERIIDRNQEYKHVQGEQRQRILEELKQTVSKIVYNMFGDADVSFIEVIIKYQARITLKDEERMLENAILALPKPFRAVKRHTPEFTEVPPKTIRLSPSADLKTGYRQPECRPRPRDYKPRSPTRSDVPSQWTDEPPPLRCFKCGLLDHVANSCPSRIRAVNTNAISQPEDSPTGNPQARGKIKRPVPIKQAVTSIKNKMAPQRDIKPDMTAQTTQKAVKVAPKSSPQEDFEEIKSEMPDNAPKGRYELNGIMTKMVDAELKDIMTQVWLALPDYPSNDIEQHVADLWMNQVGIDLANVLGLNITKRLLNVHSPLFVKVRFSGKPERERLREFLKKYNFTAFARKAVNIFAARVRTIKDFDRLCTNKDVRCGHIKVIVTPVYNFSSCPENLITNYKLGVGPRSLNEYLDDFDKDYETPKVDKSPVKKLPIKFEAENVTVKVEPTKTENVRTKGKIEIVENPKIEENPVPNKPVVNKVNKPKVKHSDPIKQHYQPSTKLAEYTILGKGDKLKSRLIEEDENDNEELSDQDILALMSEGIVLDECSGSEEE